MRPLYLAVLGVTLISSIASATPLSPSEAVEARKVRYREFGAAFKAVNDQLRSGTLIKITLRSAARTISRGSADQYFWFPVGSDTRADPKTRALPAIWSNPDGFRQAQGNFQRQANQFLQAVEAGDANQIGAQAKALGQTCAACHHTFRAEEE